MNNLDHIDYRVISALTSEQAHTFRVIPLQINGASIRLAGEESAVSHSAQLQLILGKQIHIELTPTDQISRYLIKYYPHEGAGQHQVSSANESDVVQFINKILEEAAQMKASDIHVERYESEARIRYRWEGQLIEKYEVPLEQYNAMISRIKIISELDISERRLPQDGRIHLKTGGTNIDIRVSSIPGKYGEKIVMRLLTRSQENLDLNNLGLNLQEKTFYIQAIKKPNGIILITGPTGSGKTTTLYATLNRLNQPHKNIVTIEDPIEYNLSGINQVQLKEEIGLSFDRALRAFLRQDPDIIMIGEIRDMATANIAIRAALTGHLVFSTLHTNNSWDAITRLTDMGMEPYLLAASLRLVMAQRLVRLLCEHCKEETEEFLFPEIQKEAKITKHFIAQGCPECYYTGYKGRKAVFEVLPITKELSEMIKSGEGDINAYTAKEEINRLSDNLINIVIQGITSLEEAIAHWES